MFNLTPQKREQLLVIITGIVLFAIVMLILPGRFSELTKLENNRKDLLTKIDEVNVHAKNKDEIQERLALMTSQALAASGTAKSMAMSGYQFWLTELARNAGIGNVQLRESSAAGVRGIYDKVVFTLVGECRLDQLAEFLRRFHRTDYLHMITRVTPAPIQSNPNIFNVTFTIEVLSLPQVRTRNVPDASGVAAAMTDEERQMLATIRDRAILSVYTPPPPPPPVNTTQPPPREDFNHTPFCVLTAVVMSSGRPQCWIHYRTTGQMYYLFEDESFTLDGTRATVKKIEMDAQRIHVAAAGGVYTLSLGKSFAQIEDPTYFFTGLVDASGNPWTAESTGDPLCVIVHGSEDDNGNLIEKATHRLAAGDSFPMAWVSCAVRRIDPAANQIQIEAAGTVYNIRVNGAFTEFRNE